MVSRIVILGIDARPPDSNCAVVAAEVLSEEIRDVSSGGCCLQEDDLSKAYKPSTTNLMPAEVRAVVVNAR